MPDLTLTPAARFLAAHRALAAHGVRLDGHDLSLEQAEAMAAIADRTVSPAAVLARPAVKAVA